MEGQERQLPSDRGCGLLGNYHCLDEAYIILYEILYIIFDYSHKHYTFKQFEV